MDGRITSRKAEVGTTVSPGTPIFPTGENMDTVWVAAWIDQSQIAQIEERQPAAIRLRSGRHYQGRVERINAEADTVTRELEVDIKFEQLPKPLVSRGRKLKWTLTPAGSKGPGSYPCRPFWRKTSGKGVLVADNGILRFRKVILGLEDGARTAVTEGLKEGELVVVNPEGLMPGTKIRPEIKPAAALRD